MPSLRFLCANFQLLTLFLPGLSYNEGNPYRKR